MDYKKFGAWQASLMGRRIDTDGFPRGAVFQCVDLVKDYMRVMWGIPYGAYGNAIDYWNKPHKVITNNFVKVAKDGIKTGDIVVLKIASGSPFGHAGIAVAQGNGASVVILEQNGGGGRGQGTGGDAIRTRLISISRVAGVWRHRTATTQTSIPLASKPPKKETVYIVKRGDSLSKIAAGKKFTWQQLYNKNRSVIGSDPNKIFAGQRLVFP